MKDFLKSMQDNRAVPLKPRIKPSTTNMFPTLAPDRGLSEQQNAEPQSLNSSIEGTRVLWLHLAFWLLPPPQRRATEQLTLPTSGHQPSGSKEVLAALLMILLHTLV